MRRQQQGTLCWEKTLEITGGALKPSKCYWYLVGFQWQKGEWSYKPTDNTVCNILGDKKTGHNILSLPVDKAEKIMGVWQNLTGDNTTQINAIIDKHSKMINRLRSSDMARKIVWKVFIGVLWLSMRYGLPSYAITSKKKATRSLANPSDHCSTRWVYIEPFQVK